PNRTELAGESVRAALEALAVAAPDWLAGAVDVDELAHRYGERVNGWTMPSSKTARDRVGLQNPDLGGDLRVCLSDRARIGQAGWSWCGRCSTP
ncbi:hypothetical protein AB1484_28590, partial [Parafrankia sp. FMc6]